MRRSRAPSKMRTTPNIRLPRTIKKGGVEVLSVVPQSEDTELQVEMFMKPVFASDEGLKHWIIGGPLQRGEAPYNNELMCYSLGVIQTPEIPNSVDEQSIRVWEAYRVETEVIALPRSFSSGWEVTTKNIGGVGGPQLYFWAVGGQPLDVIGITPREEINFPSFTTAPGRHDHVSRQSSREKVTSQNFPIEAWAADPSRNENCKYFGRVIGGNLTPPVVTFSNSSTIPLLDEFGVGVLCIQNRCYLTSADMLGLTGEVEEQTLGPNAEFRRVIAAPGRFFRVHFRQRTIKNPYTMSLLYKQVFLNKEPEVTAQKEVEEVTLVDDNVKTGTLETAPESALSVTNLNPTPQPLFNT
ncbi:VP1 [Bank vole polyomavirus]|uniref:Major capsid protein VP1 n=1 Tax=Bank vole polyomavirus TaxID=1737522 RepID=A0A0P0HQD5_9POLY|nr:VP1 [Bank vole polyomavirus]ALJ83702.1 VP1 [Bank vole polyomavirus]ALJ83707.1 VP1 [Bank vole polyomavirus]ALJ83712.1 VP1 [Bank vole polyomavirus]ALJ83717.1 VP1 [Bank vole polyomavirus]